MDKKELQKDLKALLLKLESFALSYL